MKQRKTIAIIMTVILVLATVLTVFAAFRFEVQFPSKLNTFTYDETTAKFAGTYSFDADLTQLQEPGQGAEFAATVTGDAKTPLTYAYTISVDGYSVNDITILDADDDATKTAKSEKIALLSSVFVYLNGEIMGTLQSLSEAGGLLGEGLYVLPNATENDTLRLELHLASDATPYENASLKVTVNCTATNHNAQKLTFVDTPEKLTQAISEVNRGAADKTIVLYGGLAVPAGLEVTKPCTFDVQENVTFAGPITVNITSEPVDNIPTDIVTVRSTKSKCDPATPGFTIAAGAIDREDSAANITITGIGNATSDSVQYIVDKHFNSVEAHGIASGSSIDLSGKGFGCYIQSITGGTLLTFADNKLTAGNVTTSTVEAVTITLTTGATHTHNIKVIGKGDDAAALFAENGDLYYLAQLAQPGVDVSYSIPLPTVLKNKNATIEWHSSDPEKFSNQGVCSPSANGYVTLTAVIRINEQVYTHDVKIHIATLTNKDRLEAMIAAMGNITLSKLYPSTATDNNGTALHVNGLIDGNYGDLPMAGTTTGGYEQYIKFAIPTQDDQGNTIEKQQITTFDISGLTYSIDKATYGYIDVVDIDAADDVSQNVVVLKQSTFNTLAEVQVTATFETGDSDQETSIIYVNIELGENKDLGDQVLAYVRNKLSEVNVLQNMLDTRVAGEEKGDFELPTEYSGFDIVYRINGDSDKNIISTIDITTDAAGNAITDTELLKKNAGIVENGQFEINAEGFKNVAHDVTVTVSVLIKGTHTISTGNVISSADMTFTVPAAIHCDTSLGFNDETLFQSVRKQVMEQATPAYSKNGDAFVDADKNYILVRDIESCTTLSIDGNGVNDTNINGLAYFENLTSFEASNFDASFASQLSRAASTFKQLTHLKLSNVGLTDITPLQGLDLVHLDVSGNAGLKDISGVAQFDATKLGYLNISGTAVDMELTRSLLTAMYYRYEANNSSAPEYYYTHEYTPIADGALLLEPDAISVTTENGTTTATIGGSELLINGATLSGTTITVGTSNTAISIDGKKSISVKAGTQITVLKGENHSSGDSVMLNDAIISFELESGMKSESFQIADLWLSGTVTISNATVSGNIITVGTGGGSLDSTVDGENMDLNQGTIPVLSGIITKDEDAKTVTITPLKYTADNDDGDVNNVGNYRNEGLTDDGTNTVIGHNNMTEIVISGASVNGTNIIVGANGGTITVKVTGQDAFTFAIRSNTTIQADTAGNMIYVNDDGTISILPIDNESPALPTTASKVTFSDAEIYNKPSTIQVTDNNGTTTTKAISIPTIRINAGCVMVINDEFSVMIPTATEIPLPSYAVGTNANGTVIVEAYDTANPGSTYNEKKFELINYEATQIDGEQYQMGAYFDFGGTYDHNGWYITTEVFKIFGATISWEATATQTVQAISNDAPKYLRINGSKWIPISTNSIGFSGSELKAESAMADWGTILAHATDSGVLSFELGSSGNYNNNNSINISGAFTGNTSSFTVGIAANNFASTTPQATLPTESINPIYAGIRTTLPNATQSIAPEIVDYYGHSIQIFGGTIALAKDQDGNQLYLTDTNGNRILDQSDNPIPLYQITFDYTWGAILVDGEYITVSDGATVYFSGTTDQCTVSTPDQGTHSAEAAHTNGTNNQKSYTDQLKITVINGTSSIGKGALVTKYDVNVTPLIGSTANPTEIYAISGGTESLVKVTYKNIGADDGLVLAIIDDIRFEPIVANDEEKAGTNILFLLSEVPGVSHYDYNNGQNNEHGTYIQLTPTVHYGNGGYYVSVTWSVDAGSMAYVQYADYYGSPRLETVRPDGLTYVNGEATVDVTVIAQVNVQGVVSTRYFTFTVTYYEN